MISSVTIPSSLECTTEAHGSIRRPESSSIPVTHSELTNNLARSEARETDSRRVAFEAGAWLAAIVENSDDAILSKTLDGIIMSWNAGAEKLFGYAAEEAIGQPITTIIPRDRLHEEEAIIRQLRAGQRVDHLETVRRRKDGSLIDVALTVSPVKDEAGNVLGASKIARDISAAKQAAARQELILRETNHRIKNLFALANGLVGLSARGATSVDELADDLSARLQSLSRARPHPGRLQRGWRIGRRHHLPALASEVLAPHNDDAASRIVIEGDAVPIGHHALPTLGLLFHGWRPTPPNMADSHRWTVGCASTSRSLATWQTSVGANPAGRSVTRPHP